MNILFAVWELDPFVKVGGLGDVASSLPRALRALGVDIRITIPFYKALKLGRNKKKFIKRIKVPYDGKEETVDIYEVEHPTSHVPVYLIKNTKYLGTPVFPDTFAFFNKTIVPIVTHTMLAWTPNIIHCNDSHTSLIPLLLKVEKSPIKSMLTIHNLTYQGKTSLDILTKIGLNQEKSAMVQWEIESKQINFLLEGIIHADIITTVSPTYAKEILTEANGAGLEEFLRGKEGKIFGVLNGIDDHRKETMRLPHIKYPKSSDTAYSWKEDKRISKAYLQKKLGLKVDPTLPLLSFIGRFDPKQKGIDILHKMMRTIDITKYEFAILGTGDVEWEERFLWLDTFYPKNISCTFVFDDTLAHQIYAASDFILVPSKFEPCGLIQMIAMSYGTLPIAHKTGGLMDSIQDKKNGFLYDHDSAETLREAMEAAVHLWRHKKQTYDTMVEHALLTDFSWDKSAKEYLRLYGQLLDSSSL